MEAECRDKPLTRRLLLGGWVALDVLLVVGIAVRLSGPLNEALPGLGDGLGVPIPADGS